MSKKPEVGEISWIDLTVEDAEGVRDFYKAVVGWNHDAVSMGDYDDFNMIIPSSGTPAAGICHARGGNAGIPPVWMIYLTVADIDASVKQCMENGGSVIHGPKDMAGYGRYCMIKDPAGAMAALYQPVAESS